MSQDAIIAKIEELPDDISIILDIGCNTGREIPHLTRRWPAARIIAIEPNHNVLAEFARHYPHIEVHCLAIGSENGKCLFYPSDRRGSKAHSGSSSIRKPKDHLTMNPDVTFSDPYEVSVKKLDTFCSEINVSHVDFIWMDVQGCEGDVICGGPLIISRSKFIYTEAYENEMYEGQVIRNDLLKMLSCYSNVEIEDKYNILLKNKFTNE